MRIFHNKIELKKHLAALKNEKKTIGFVPTMGALHKGHLSLVEQAQKHTDIVVVSIFVNPTQFDNKEDLEKYPQTLEADTTLLKTIDCDIVYAPTANEIYEGNIAAEHFEFDGLEHQMEGKFRDGHFDGVGTIVKKLFEIVTPDVACFGQKDFQQLQIINKLVEKHKIPVQIIGCSIFREADGLAMSSRNTRLTKEHRENAPFIYKTLKQAQQKFNDVSPEELTQWVEDEFSKNKLLKLEYFTVAEEESLKTAVKKDNTKKYRGFIAAYAGEIRLIDNISLG